MQKLNFLRPDTDECSYGFHLMKHSSHNLNPVLCILNQIKYINAGSFSFGA